MAIKKGDEVTYNGLALTVLETDEKTAVCQWITYDGKYRADLFRNIDLKKKRKKK
jgi:hypothetical protein